MNLQQEVKLFKNHSGVIGYWHGKALADDNGGVVEMTHAKKLDGKPVTSRYSVERKNVGRSNETTFIMQSVFELQSRVNKQLDKGYVRTLEEAEQPATNALGLLKPMLAQPLDKVKPEKIDWEAAFLQPKLDGHRCLVNGILYSRNGKEIQLPHIREQLGDAGLLNANLDGELYIHGMMLQDIGSLVKKPREESLKLKLYVYDIISPAPYHERFDELISRVAKADLPAIELLTTVPVTSKAQVDIIHRDWLADGYEGSILRHGTDGYADGKRSSSLIKLKGFEDFEFEVVGYERGTPNGGFEVPVWVLANPFATSDKTATFRATAAGSLKEKHSQWEERDSLIGRKLTVQYFGLSEEGGVLLPVALRWREDI